VDSSQLQLSLDYKFIALERATVFTLVNVTSFILRSFCVNPLVYFDDCGYLSLQLFLVTLMAVKL